MSACLLRELARSSALALPGVVPSDIQGICHGLSHPQVLCDYGLSLAQKDAGRERLGLYRAPLKTTCVAIAALKTGSKCSFTTRKLRFFACFCLALAASPTFLEVPYRSEAPGAWVNNEWELHRGGCSSLDGCDLLRSQWVCR